MFYTGALSNCIYVLRSALYKESLTVLFNFRALTIFLLIEATKCLVKDLLSTTWS